VFFLPQAAICGPERQIKRAHDEYVENSVRGVGKKMTHTANKNRIGHVLDGHWGKSVTG
jgi:hypothetical protein